MKADLGLDCLLIYRKDDRCQSFNFVMSLHLCEFSDRTKEARPEDFIPDPDRYYFRRDIDRGKLVSIMITTTLYLTRVEGIYYNFISILVPLGSVAQLAAASCKEIKDSEGDVVSGKYWLSTIKKDKAVNAFCDMKTEG